MPDADEVLGLTGVADVVDQIPDDVYADAVLEATYAERELTGIVSAVRENLQGRAGDTVKVPYIARRAAQGPVAAGGALAATAESTGVYAIQLKKFGDYDKIENEALEDQTNFDIDAFARNQAAALAEKVDQLVYDELETAAAANVITLAAADSLSDLYDKIVDAKAAMERQKGYKPSHVILGPDQVGQLLKDKDEGIKVMQIVAKDGEVTRVAGLTVVKTALANPDTSDLDAVQAIVIDKRRAVAEVWGRPPNLTVDRVSDAPTDETRLITWIRYNAGELDPKATAHITNPSA